MAATRIFIAILIILFSLGDASAASKLVDVRLDLGSTTDTQGNLTVPQFYRESAATYVDANGVLQTNYGNRTNGIAYSEDMSNAWWTKDAATATTASGIIGNNGTTTEMGVRRVIMSAGVTYVFSVSVKAGSKGWAYIFSRGDTTLNYLYVNAATGAIGATSGFTAYSTAGVAEAGGYYRFYVVFTADATLATYNRLGVWVATADGNKSVTSDGTTVDLYATRFQLEALPTGSTIGPDLMDQEVLGAELAVNGTFTAWTGDDPDSWTVNGESGSDPMVTQASGKARIYSSSSPISIRQLILTSGKIYKITFDITASVGGTIKVGSDASYVNDIFSNISTVGAYTTYFKARGDTLFFMRQGYPCDITIDNVSVKEVTAPAKGQFHGTAMLGSDLLTNGSFETAGAGAPDLWGTWVETVAGGDTMADSATAYLGSHAATLTYVDNGATYISNTVTVAANRLYKLEFYTRGDATVGGRYGIYDVSNSANIVAATATGITAATYTKVTKYFYTPTGCTSARIDLYTPTAAGVAYYDYVSVRLVQTSFTKFGANTIEIDEAEGSGGALKFTYVDNATAGQVYLADASDQSANLTAARWYQLSYKAKVSAAGSVNVTVKNGVDPWAEILSIAITETSLTQKTVYFRADHTSGMLVRITNLGAGESIWIDDLTIKQVPDYTLLTPATYTATTGSSATIPALPRFDYAGGVGGLLLEGEGVNLVESSDFSTGWVMARATVATGQPDPAGGVGAYKLMEDLTAGNSHYYYYAPTMSLVDSTVHTFSVFIKAGTRTKANIGLRDKTGSYKSATVNLVAGTITNNDFSTVGIQSVGGGWYRAWGSVSSATGTTVPRLDIYLDNDAGSGSYDGLGTGYYLYIFGPQLEATAFPTSYIPTAGVPRIRTTSAGNGTGPVGMRWTMSTALKNALGAASPSVGTVILNWTPLWTQSAVYGLTPGILSTADTASATVPMLLGNSTKVVLAGDGTNVTAAGALPIPVANVTHSLVSRFDSTANGGAGYLLANTKNATTWYNSTTVAYDGSFLIGTYLWLNYGNEYPAKFGRLRIFDYWITDANLATSQIEPAVTLRKNSQGKWRPGIVFLP